MKLDYKIFTMIKKLLIHTLAAFLLVSCSGLKNTHQQLASGNYDVAIDNALNYLFKKRYGKKAPDFNKVLFESFNKAVTQDKRTLAYLNSDPNPESLERMFETYLHLEQRQNKIRPLLPIEGYRFNIENYATATLNTRNKLSEYLYEKASNKLKTYNKQFVREAHDDFKYLQKINPNYKNVPDLITQSHQKGTDFVFVQLQNNTQYSIPNRLKRDLLNMQQYKLNNYWTLHHSKRVPNINYNYNLTLSFTSIELSPEQQKEVHIIKEKQVKDGFKYALDAKGNVKKDAEGNDIKTDRFIKVRSNLHQYTQFKECTIFAKALITNNTSKQIVSSTPYRSNFVFEHVYATQSGDRRALARQYLDLLQVRAVRFPSNEQMILDAGNDIKNQLQRQLTGLRF